MAPKEKIHRLASPRKYWWAIIIPIILTLKPFQIYMPLALKPLKAYTLNCKSISIFR
jgi:hypothetical protein